MGIIPATLRIELGDVTFAPHYDWAATAAANPCLLEKQCRSKEEFIECLDRIAGWLIEHREHSVATVLQTRERELAPPTEMTLEEIEKALGYRVKIVEEKSTQ